MTTTNAESSVLVPASGTARSRAASGAPAVANSAALAALVHQHARNNGATPTAVSFLSLLRSNEGTPFTPGMLKPSVCLVVQGAKKILIGKEVISYGAGNFLAASVDMPTSGHVVVASRTKPYLSVRIELKPSEVATIALDAKLQISATSTPGAYVGTADADLHDAVMRLMRLLSKPQDIPFLARSIKQEIIYRLLTSPDGHLLYHNIVADNHGVGIGKALRWIKSNYAQPLHIEQLARDVNLSVSGFHHKFKAVTTIPPLQYQKRIRLARGSTHFAGGQRRCRNRRIQGGVRKRLTVQSRIPAAVWHAPVAGCREPAQERHQRRRAGLGNHWALIVYSPFALPACIHPECARASAGRVLVERVRVHTFIRIVMKPITTSFGFSSTAAEVAAGINLSGKRAIVTGAASGIGVETARELARAGAEVTLAVRNIAAGQQVAADIKATTGNDNVVVAPLDLAIGESVNAFVEAWQGPLHMLVNNAGIMACPETRTHEGWEMQFATNHLGHFALTTGLHGALVQAKNARVVNVNSRGHLRADVTFDDIHFQRRAYDPWLAYGQSKTANVLFSVEITERWKSDGITSNALMPGVIRTPLSRYMTQEQLDAVLQRAGGDSINWKTVEQGAATTVLLATSPLLEGIGGRYFDNCNEAAVYVPGGDFNGVGRVCA